MLEGMGMPVRLMPHDVPTWWNSSADIVEFALEYHEPLNAMTQKRDLGLRSLELSDEEWRVLKELHTVLKVCPCQSLEVIKTKINKTPTDSERHYHVLLMHKSQPCDGDSCNGSHQQSIYHLLIGPNLLPPHP